MKALPRHHLRVPDERARLRAHEGHARVARLRGGAASARDADLILFNTCSIREKADERFVAHLHEARALKRARPGARDRRRRLLGAVGQGGGLPPVPVRRRRLRPRPGPQAGRVPDLRLAHRPGLLRVRGLHRPPARQARARVPGAGCRSRVGCNCSCSYCIVPSTRGREVSRPLEELVDGGRAAWPPTACARSRCSARTSTPTGATCGRERRSFAELLHALDAIDGLDRIRYTSPHPKDMREDVIRAHAELATVCEHIHLPLQSGSSRDPQGDAPHLRPRALPGPRRADPRARARLRDHDRHHRRLPGRDRGGLRGDARGRRGGRLRRRVHVHLLAAPRDRGGGAHRRARAARGQGRAHGAARRGRPAPRARARPALRRPHARRARRGPVAQRRRRACAGARATTRSSTSPASRRPGEIVPVAIDAATSQTLAGEESLLSRAAA